MPGSMSGRRPSPRRRASQSAACCSWSNPAGRTTRPKSTSTGTFPAVKQERFGLIDFDRFHRNELPALLDRRAAVFSAADAEVVRPLGFQVSDGRVYTYVPEGKTFSVQPGTGDAETVVELSPGAWSDFVWELKPALRCSTQIN